MLHDAAQNKIHHERRSRETRSPVSTCPPPPSTISYEETRCKSLAVGPSGVLLLHLRQLLGSPCWRLASPFPLHSFRCFCCCGSPLPLLHSPKRWCCRFLMHGL